MYTLLTGYPPFYHLEGVEELNATLSRGETAFVDPRFRDRSPGERVLADLIPRCWDHNPDNRVGIVEMVEILEAAVLDDKENDEND